jgi:4-hydroxybenzoate polyprenyltransferase
MVFARTWAMLVNRLVDRRFDARNDRTRARVFADGRVSPALGWTVALGCAALFTLACAGFWLFFNNPWPTYLALPTLLWIAFYSFTKRFTALCHVFLGGALAASPLAAAIAINPASLLSTPSLWWLSGFVLLWVAGFDVIYALADEAFDRAAGLHSLPSRAGRHAALWASRGMHAAAILMLLAAFTSLPAFGWTFGVAVAATALLLATEHAIMILRGNQGIPLAFFTLNGVVSCLLGLAGIADLLV